MIWILRPGQNACYLDTFLQDNRIYIPWGGYDMSLENCIEREDFRAVVINEKGEINRTSLSNWSGQLYSFCKEMNVGDFVMIPHRHSHKYVLAEVTGDYGYDAEQKELKHYREMRIVTNDIPQDIFSQSVRYSLGAFRTLFKVKHINEVVSAISKFAPETAEPLKKEATA